MVRKRYYGLLLVVFLAACVEPFIIKDTAHTDMLVVEGVITNQFKRHQIFLSRATRLADKRIIRERGASVTISDESGSVIAFTEETPGLYETPEFAASAGHSYTLHITTSAGEEYVSLPATYKDGSDIFEVYAKFVNEENGRGVEIYADTEDPSGRTRFYRWNYTETYEVHAPFPSVWNWIGDNNVEPRTDGFDVCYASDTLRSIFIRHTKDLAEDKITAQPIRFIPEQSYIMRERYSILVQQYSLAEESYLYWENLKTISEKQGSLSDVQPGTLTGNIISITNPEETALGYFEACKMSEKRIFFNSTVFFNDGLKFPTGYRSYCYEIEPILVDQAQLDEAMNRYQNTMYIWDAFGMSPATTFELMPKSCCDCRDEGSTERPSFF